MAYAAYRESIGAVLFSPAPITRPICMVLDVTVPSRDALLVRRALISCPETGVLRCHLQRHGMTQGF